MGRGKHLKELGEKAEVPLMSSNPEPESNVLDQGSKNLSVHSKVECTRSIFACLTPVKD